MPINAFEHQFAIGAATPSALLAILKNLMKQGLAEFTNMVRFLGDAGTPNDGYNASLTFDGWLAYEDLARGKTSGRTAFMAMPFNKPDLDDEWFPRLKEAVAETGFTLKRTLDEPKPGLIDISMREQIKRARFLIVELTHANNGAYWEAGFAEGLGKPVIYTRRTEGEKAHFDVEHSWRVDWTDETMDKALKHLKDIIRNALPDAAPEPALS